MLYSLYYREIHALYYVKNLPQVKMIVESLEDDALLVKRAKESLVNEYKIFHASWWKFQDAMVSCRTLSRARVSKQYFTIREAKKVIEELRFEEDPLGIQGYIKYRLMKNDLNEMFEMKRGSISPSTYSRIIDCHPTGIPVARSFSMLNKLLSKDRNFLPESIPAYMRFYFNKFA